MYVIVRSDGAFVSDPSTNGTGSSYTRDLSKAKTFRTRESAERELCPENERIRDVEECLRAPR